MVETYAQQQFSVDPSGRLRDLEEKMLLLKDRVLLVGQTLVDERDKTFREMQEMKKSLILMKEETNRIKELVERITEQLNGVARKEEIMILQRQLDLLRK
jgi:hypothetical protein